jgi:hypothetical protein
LGKELEFSFQAEGQTAESMGFVEKEAALAALPTGDSDLKAVWIRKNPPLFEHQVELQAFADCIVSLAFWDNYSDEYSPTGPSEAQRAEIRSFALTLYRALVKDAGAIVSFVGVAPDKYPGSPHLDDVASMIRDAVRTGPSRVLKLVLEYASLCWILVLDKKALAKALPKYRKKLEKHLNVVEETPDWLIHESNEWLPFFLSWGRAARERT